MRKLRQITVIGMGLLGASITLAILRLSIASKVVGYSHRAVTRRKSRRMGVADEISDDICESVCNADMVIIASPVGSFGEIFQKISSSLKSGCIVTDVGSTKVLPHRWAERFLGKNVCYVGSHPIAGSEKRGVEFARDDLFMGSRCILTRKKNTNSSALRVLRDFWSKLGCRVHVMNPASHDRIFGRVSHLPHVTAAALINASDAGQLRFCGRGFIDTSRVASGPANVWSDILMTNPDNAVRAIDRVVKELLKLRCAINDGNEAQLSRLLERARLKRKELIAYKMRRKELPG